MYVCNVVKDLAVPAVEDPVRSDSGYSGAFRCSGLSPYWEAGDKPHRKGNRSITMTDC